VLEEGVQPLVLAAIIGLHSQDFLIKYPFNKIIEIKKMLKKTSDLCLRV
jgi:hypothetical protein